MATAQAGQMSAGKGRVFHSEFGLFSRRVLPGHFDVTDAKDEMVVTVLGSCVAACIRNPFTGFGGLNHFMLPASDDGEWSGAGAALRYGNFAMEALINEILKSGCFRNELEIKIFGGSDKHTSRSGVGAKNIAFVKRYLQDEGLQVTAMDLGGVSGRMIYYVPSTGKVHRRFLDPEQNKDVLHIETKYRKTLKVEPVEGEISLFD